MNARPNSPTAPVSTGNPACARRLPQHFNGCSCRPVTQLAEVDDIAELRGFSTRDFSYVTMHTPIPDDINSWDAVDRYAFYDALHAASESAWGVAPVVSPSRKIELAYSRVPTHPAEPGPCLNLEPAYVATGTGVARCPGCEGTGVQMTSIGDRVCFLCEGAREVRQERAASYISDVKKLLGPKWGEKSDPDYEAIAEDRGTAAGAVDRDAAEARAWGVS